MDDRRKKRGNNQSVNMDTNTNNGYNQNNNMNSGFYNNSNMNNGFNNQNNNMNNGFNNQNNNMNNGFNNQNNNMNNGFNNQNNNMNNGFNNQNNNMNNGFNNQNNNMNNGFNNQNNNMNNGYNQNNNMNNDITHLGYQEKQYKTGSLEENTVVAKTSKLSRIFLFGFYLIFIVIGIMAFFLIKSDKYQFYLKNDEVTIFSGSTYQVELIPKNMRYFDMLNYDYKIADESIATVDEFGNITAVGTGTTTLKISLSPGFTSKTMKIHSEKIEITNIELVIDRGENIERKGSIELLPDQNFTLKPIANGREDLNLTVKYSSSNTDVAVVDEYGNVTAKGSGTAIISGERDGVIGSITVVVKKKNAPTPTSPPVGPTPTPGSNPTGTPVEATPTPMVVQSISFSNSNITLYKGSTVTLDVNVVPNELSNAQLTWSSSNPSVATVANGVVTGKGDGTATITATTSNGKSATCNVTVSSQAIKIDKLTLSGSSVTIYVGNSAKFGVTISPSNATVRDVKWSSSDSNIATVNQSGIVTGKSAGTTTIVVSTADGSIKATATVKVISPTPTPVPTKTPASTPTPKVTQAPTTKPTTKPTNTAAPKVTKVSLGLRNPFYKNVGDAAFTISPIVEPSTASGYTIKWSSSNPSVASVDKNGVVTVSKDKSMAGKSTVITAEINGVKGTAELRLNQIKDPKPTTAPTNTATVDQPKGADVTAAEVTLKTTELAVSKGGTATFTVKVSKAAGKIKVTSSNKNILTVTPKSVSAEDEDIKDICVGEVCFFDKWTITYTVTGVSAGTAYVNVTIDDLANYDGKVVTGSGKVGVLVK